MNELELLRAADFDWTVRLNDVWGPPPADVPELHADYRASFVETLEKMERHEGSGSPLGWVLVGPGGSGKTHLMGAFRREAARRGHPFVMVDLTDVKDFWASVLQGYVHSLQKQIEDDVPQHRWVLGNIIRKLGPSKPVAQVLKLLADRKSEDLRGDMNKVLQAMHKVWPAETLKYQNVIRAVICMNSDDFATTNLGQVWLQGQALEPEDKKALGFTAEAESPRRIIEALSWFMSLSGPAVLAFDQLDPIVTQLHYRRLGDPSTEEQAAAESIIAEIGGGLGALRDVTHATLTVVSCIETTWEFLLNTVLKSSLDRFEGVRTMGPLRAPELARTIAAERLAPAFRAAGVTPAYPTYPFLPEAFDSLALSQPREVLKRCKAHLDAMLERGRVTEIARLDAPPGAHPAQPPHSTTFDQEFDALRRQADPARILEEKHEDERLAPLIRAGLSCLLHEIDPPSDVDAKLEVDFTGGSKTAPLHARLHRIYHKELDREEHYSVRAIQHANPRAYQNQLTSALTNSGIDRRLPFRRLAVVRSISPPGGAKTAELTAKFEACGGVFVKPTEDDLRTLHALNELKSRPLSDLLPWLKANRPASGLSLIRGVVGDDFFRPTPPPKESQAPGAKTKPASENGPPPGSKPVPGSIPLGRRVAGNVLADSFHLPIPLLEKHTLVMAGAGSGKTVFLKRLVEEAALAGVPSIVVDCANDLAALGDRWEAPPQQWGEDDPAKADRYHVPGRVVVWTPNRTDGNPLWFEPLPDLASLADAPEELNDAIEGVRASLAPIVAKGKTQAADQKLGVLSGALRYLARHGGGGRIEALIEVLSDLPPEAGLGLQKEAKLAAEMADALRVAMEVDPLMRAKGTPFDPALLFGSADAGEPARVSVISLAGLPGLEAQRRFVNQLAMTLFAWVKKNPNPGGRPLRGLLVIDEARDFIPSQAASTCRESLLRLGAQARKYHLGLVFATQNPKDVDPKLVGNCSTHVYGKMNAPASIEAVRDLIRQKGGSGDDVPRLPAGRFYVHNADAGLTAPVKLQTSFCLSRHPSSPLDEATIVARAASARRRAPA